MTKKKEYQLGLVPAQKPPAPPPVEPKPPVVRKKEPEPAAPKPPPPPKKAAPPPPPPRLTFYRDPTVEEMKEFVRKHKGELTQPWQTLVPQLIHEYQVSFNRAQAIWDAVKSEQ